MLAQPYQGGESSGFDFQLLSLCNSEFFSFQSSGSGSGFDTTAFYACSDIVKYTGSGIGSGFDFQSNYFCDSLNQKPSYKGDSLSGFQFASIGYCIPFFVRGDSMSGHFFNSIYYCTPITYNGTNSSGHAFVIANCLIPLPVENLEFYAIKQNLNAILSWKVTHEINVDFYEVLRSLDL